MNNTYLVHHGVKGQEWGVRNAEWYPISAYIKSLHKDKKTRARVEAADKKRLSKWAEFKAKEREENKREKAEKKAAKVAAKEAAIKKKADDKKKEEFKRRMAEAREKKRIADAQKKEQEEQKAKEEAERKQKHDQLLEKGNANDVYANKDLFTPQELQQIANRFQQEENIKKYMTTNQENVSKGKQFVDGFKDVTATMGTVATGLQNVNNLMANGGQLYSTTAKTYNAMVNAGLIKGKKLPEIDFKPKKEKSEIEKIKEETARLNAETNLKDAQNKHDKMFKTEDKTEKKEKESKAEKNQKEEKPKSEPKKEETKSENSSSGHGIPGQKWGTRESSDPDKDLNDIYKNSVSDAKSQDTYKSGAESKGTFSTVKGFSNVPKNEDVDDFLNEIYNISLKEAKAADLEDWLSKYRK